MNQKLLHTPEGVRDIYNAECQRKRQLENRIGQVMDSYGYDLIETPTFEFFDVFSSAVGTISDRELFKFFDREGNTLVLRPDFTPSIARAAAKYFMEEDGPIRLCYQGHAFVNHVSLQGRLKENTQMGAELIGESGADGDAEIIAMVIETLRKAGLEEFQISLGHVQYFSALVREAGLRESDREELQTLIRNKNSFGAEKLLQTLEISDRLREAFVALPGLFGGEEILQRAAALAGEGEAGEAVDRLKEVYELLKVYGLERYVSFDLGMMSSYMYYTGIIFRGYTYGTGDAVVKGGRYDALLRHFGKDAPSIGFVVVIDQLMNALSRQKIRLLKQEERTVIHYGESTREEAIKEAMRLRAQGRAVVLSPDPSNHRF